MDPTGFPWGSNNPTTKQRLIVAAIVAAIAAAALAIALSTSPRHTDFSLVRFAARSIVAHRNPYPLVGPGLEFEWPYKLIYPATSFVAALPFAWMSERIASVFFVAVSTFLLVYGSTRDSWHRLPMFVSAAFADSVFAAQWTIILTAALFIPWLGILLSAKPQNGLPVLAAGGLRALKFSIIGAVVLASISFVFLPQWLSDWLATLPSATHMKSPLLLSGGLLALPALMRWRLPEAWLVFLAALLPQTLMWYSAFILLAVAKTYREACVLSLVSSLGFVLAAGAATMNLPRIGLIVWICFIGSTYVPAMIAVLMRPNATSRMK